jgi:hypothetical protein
MASDYHNAGSLSDAGSDTGAISGSGLSDTGMRSMQGYDTAIVPDQSLDDGKADVPDRNGADHAASPAQSPDMDRASEVASQEDDNKAGSDQSVDAEKTGDMTGQAEGSEPASAGNEMDRTSEVASQEDNNEASSDQSVDAEKTGDMTRQVEGSEPTSAGNEKEAELNRVGQQGGDIARQDNDKQGTQDIAEKQTIGTPEQDVQHYHPQEGDDTCAIAAQRGIIEKHTGRDPGEEALRQQASENEWYTEGKGTATTDMGKQLEANDVPVGFEGEADMSRLESELAQGHDVIAAVDSGSLWNDPDYDGEGHAVWVTGLEKDDVGKVTSVFVNDSGNPELAGGGKVKAEDFQRAWAGSKNYMLSTRDKAVRSP